MILAKEEEKRAFLCFDFCDTYEVSQSLGVVLHLNREGLLVRQWLGEHVWTLLYVMDRMPFSIFTYVARATALADTLTLQNLASFFVLSPTIIVCVTSDPIRVSGSRALYIFVCE